MIGYSKEQQCSREFSNFIAKCLDTERLRMSAFRHFYKRLGVSIKLIQNNPSKSFFIDVPGGKVFVREWTPVALANPIPIVLLHDSLGCIDMWRDFPRQLANHLKRQVYAYDRLGYGQSSARISPPSLEFIDEEANSVFPDLCRQLNLKTVSLFGHSVGGGMAIAIASMNAHAGLCESVITESAQAFVEERTLEGITAAKTYFSDPQHLSKLEKYHGSKAKWVLDAWTEIWLDSRFSNWNLDHHLKRINCPVLAIHGDRDEYGSCAFPQRISSGVDTYSTSVILEDFGHVPHREDPTRIIGVVSRFLQEVESMDGC